MKNLKVILTIGTIAAGKSTWAKQFVKENETYIRINRDDLRLMVKDSPMLKKKGEEYITLVQNNAILDALMMKYNVIIDNTNLKVEYIEAICDLVKYKADVEFRIFDITLLESTIRNSKRDNPVPNNVVRTMFANYRNLMSTFEFAPRDKQIQIFENPKKDHRKDAVVFDLDGSLCHMNNKRNPYDFDKVYLDDCDSVLKEHLYYHHSVGRKIILLSGRDDSCYEMTEEWLKQNMIPFHHMFMRNTGDQRKDSIVKEDIYNCHIKDDFNIIVVYDDRQQVVDMWRNKLGLKCFQVEAGKF